MIFELDEINRRAKEEPEKFIRACDEAYDAKVKSAAQFLVKEHSRVVLLTGPSGSGKTTTARKLASELLRCGKIAYAISMDDYYLTVNEETMPRTEDGEIDYESPLLLNMELLQQHLETIEDGGEIVVPEFNFLLKRSLPERGKRLILGENDIVIFEGIHAFNPALTDFAAKKIYVDAVSSIYSGGEMCFKGSWNRFVRRMLRDSLFRGADAKFTISLWERILRGERLYIRPYRESADITIDSTYPCEAPIMKSFVLPMLIKADADFGISGEYREVMEGLKLFEEIDSKLLPSQSLLREFIGGSSYH